MLQAEIFQKQLLHWFNQHGRKNLPWQHPRTPYRVWLSEVMLQQTQVKTVIPYFNQFIEAFPEVTALAQAPLDKVLHLWSGLGYYARARNLHKAAQIISKKGQFPKTLEELIQLPGIGQSTAGAILSLGFNQPTPILDGNVKRVLTRLHGIQGWPGLSFVEKELWHLSSYYLPKSQAADYTQAIMDLGSLVCIRPQPLCQRCPLSEHCIAYQSHQTHHYPTPKPRKQLPTKSIHLLILINEKKEILLEKRPPVGIWGGLWSLPQCALDEEILTWCQRQYGYTPQTMTPLPLIRHTFSHFHLDMFPLLCQVQKIQLCMENTSFAWHTTAMLSKKGLSAPIKKLLNTLM